MQITTVSQITKSIRSPSFEFRSGSQGMKRATAVATAAASNAIVIKRTIAPLRTGAEPTQRLGSVWLLVTGRGRVGPGQTRRLNGTRSKAVSNRRWRNPRLGSEPRGRRHRHRRDRRDPDGDRDHRRRPVADLLVVVERLRRRPPARVRRRRPALLGAITSRGQAKPGPGRI